MTTPNNVSPVAAEERQIIDANVLEKMAKERPNECFLKGSGVLKLTGAIRQLEARIRELEGSAAIGASVQDGYRLVPVEATKEMCKAAVIFANGLAVYKTVPPKALEIEEKIYAEAYEAMLSAAPSPVKEVDKE